uniref:Uncharacterized protein n=1 Tax=Rousettus aegyptiacus TaxID=9407 RepID=A0A7J8HS86_ROUAE|nr:hypothetical protein HJG63_010925 [Rousettus aegyptiacus]
MSFHVTIWYLFSPIHSFSFPFALFIFLFTTSSPHSPPPMIFNSFKYNSISLLIHIFLPFCYFLILQILAAKLIFSFYLSKFTILHSFFFLLVRLISLCSCSHLLSTYMDFVLPIILGFAYLCVISYVSS